MLRFESAALASAHFLEDLNKFMAGDMRFMVLSRLPRFLSVALSLSAGMILPMPAWSAPEARISDQARQSWLFHEAMASMDGRYDPAVGLLRGTVLSSSHPVSHPIRESSWYAFGLMMRNGPSDQQRA